MYSYTDDEAELNNGRNFSLGSSWVISLGSSWFSLGSAWAQLGSARAQHGLSA